MKHPPTLSGLGKKVFFWMGVPGLMLAFFGALIIFRDSIAVAPDKFAGLESAYMQTAAQTVSNCRDLKQSTIDGLRAEIRNITVSKAGASPEVLAVLLALEQSVNKLIAKAESEKEKC